MLTNTGDSRDIGELGGEQCPDTRSRSIPGEEEKRIWDLPDTETGDMDTKSDNTQVPKDDELDLQLDLVEDEEVTERDPANMDLEETRRNGGVDVTTLSEGRSRNVTSVETTAGSETESDQLKHNVGLNEEATRIAQDSEDDAAMIEHPTNLGKNTEGSEEWCHDNATATVNV